MNLKREFIFLRILLPFMIGIISVYPYPDTLWYWIAALTMLILVFSLLILNIGYARFKIYRQPWCVGILITAFFYAAGVYLCLNHNLLLNKTHFINTKGPVLFAITIADEPRETKEYFRFSATVSESNSHGKWLRSSGRIMVMLKKDLLKPVQLNYGDVLLTGTAFTAVDPPFNPGEFDFKAWLATQNIHHQLFLDTGAYYKTGQNNGNSLIGYALKLRKNQVKKYAAMLKNKEALAVASTLVLGYRADLDPETIAAYSKTGTIHALSVSGAHVAIIYLFLDYLFFFLNGRASLRYLKVGVITLLLWGYAMLTGFSPSVLRAVIMITVFICSKLLNKSVNNYNILAFSAFCILIYNPFLIYDVGFQLSYLAVIGLIYFQPKFYNLFHFKYSLGNKLWNLISLSLAAQLITYPLSIYYFHQFPVYFLAANLFIILPVNLIMGLGTLVLIPGLTALGPIFEWTINTTNNVLKWIADLPFSGITAIYISKTELILLTGALVACSIAFDFRNKKALFTGIILLLCFQLHLVYDKLQAFHQRFILFYTLKKNYAVAFIHSNQAILFTDLKENDKNYNFFIKPALEKFKISNIKIHVSGERLDEPDLLSDSTQISFFGYRILMYGPALKNKILINPPRFDAIWLHNNKYIAFDRLRALNIPVIIADATNKPYFLENLKKELKLSPVKVLKKSPALILVPDS